MLPTVDVPETLADALSPAWLTRALGRQFPGVNVTGSRLGPVISRVSTNARFHIDCEGDLPDGLPSELCVKGYFSEIGSRQAGEPEALFYRDLAAKTGVRTLHSVYAEVDAATRHGVVITGDVAAEGATFLDALSPYSPEQAAASLDQYAVLHGRTWADPKLQGVGWLAPRISSTMRARGLPEIRGNFEGPIGAGVPPEIRDAERLLDTMRVLANSMGAVAPWCLLHGDAHVGNLFLDGTGRPCLVDWQLVQRGPWYLDVGYHIGCTLPVEDRRQAERDLLAHYLQRLALEGGEVPSWDEAWRSLASGILYGFFLWAITLKVKPAITTEMLTRLGAAVVDHDAYSVVLAE